MHILHTLPVWNCHEVGKGVTLILGMPPSLWPCRGGTSSCWAASQTCQPPAAWGRRNLKVLSRSPSHPHPSDSNTWESPSSGRCAPGGICLPRGQFSSQPGCSAAELPPSVFQVLNNAQIRCPQKQLQEHFHCCGPSLANNVIMCLALQRTGDGLAKSGCDILRTFKELFSLTLPLGFFPPANSKREAAPAGCCQRELG